MPVNELWLPEHYQGLMRDADFEAHERLAATTLDSYIAGMPEAKLIEGNTGWQMRYFDIRGNNEADSRQAAVVLFPFANGYVPPMHIRIEAMRALLPEDTRVIAVPNNTADEEYHSPRVGLEKCGVAGSDLHNLGSRVLELCYDLEIEHPVFIGYSQGAATGAIALSGTSYYGRFRQAGALLAEPPNVADRTPKQLRKAFTAGGTKPFNKAVNDSGIPALAEAQHARGGSDSLRQLRMFARFALKDSRDPMNRDIQVGMSKNSFASSLHSINEGIPKTLTVAAMEKSMIFPMSIEASKVLSLVGGENHEIIMGYGHEGGDNVMLHALMARNALIKAGFYSNETA